MRQTAIWLSRVRAELGDGLHIVWRSFALEQSNNKEGPDWKAWEQGPEYASRGLLALRAGAAARRQGDAEHWRFALNLLEAKHVGRQDIRDRVTVVEIAGASGLDGARFERDLDDPETLRSVVEDHELGASTGAFGTPTFVFEDGGVVFLKMYTPPETETMDAFEHVIGLSRGRRYFGELKRPQPPWPRGALDDL